ncbi:hypothetical protein TSOC_002706 [Tetrabaena socialis]|uniref:DNA primase/polymerase bifunctional N-terminal domain-containing protein n=1 Tax=Tetrabaena socialis TaxID=47790 RepID=A0A2J8ADG6_9CHLO|nr:hypothetical protein TSOC_002706 [Tetrabaena socialis]|eukprot:PNH10549.1 hypothetical protein TSOC_002706 [Tetrabaena socialis]
MSSSLSSLSRLSDLSDLSEYLEKVSSFLRAHFPNCILIPTKSNNKTTEGASNSKNPLVVHKGVSIDKLWKNWDEKHKGNCSKGLLIVMRSHMLVLDVDDEDVAHRLVENFPSLKTTATQKTSSGYHFFFRRTAACDKMGLFDKARCLFDSEKNVLPIDIKTVCSTGTGGAISIFPSPNKKWIRALYDHPPIDLPDDLFESGNNAKSTFANLVLSFFGRLAKTNTKFVCKGSFDRAKDDHDAGLAPLKGKRLIIAEELKAAMTLDEAMIKQYTGGAGVIVEGRHLGSANTFRYVWQAGFMLIFNEGCCPKFDVGDAAFAGRMIVAPMRSKFVARELTQTEEPYTYKMDKELAQHFPTWMSSLADLLLEHFDINGLDDDRIPDVMKEWQKDILADSNPIAQWMDTHVKITGLPEDFVVLGMNFH